jgi:hypothetical protein
VIQDFQHDSALEAGIHRQIRRSVLADTQFFCYVVVKYSFHVIRCLSQAEGALPTPDNQQ